jgi:Lar family restriction alleviation protein
MTIEPTVSDAETLLPCPFCGGEARYQTNGLDRARYGEVVCNACDFCGPAHSTKAEAIAAWNRRSAIPETEAVHYQQRQKYNGGTKWSNWYDSSKDAFEEWHRGNVHGKYFFGPAVYEVRALYTHPVLPDTREETVAEGAMVVPDEATVERVARSIAVHGVGRPWGDFAEVDVDDIDRSDLRDYALAAILELGTQP